MRCTTYTDGSCGNDWSVEIDGLTYRLVGKEANELLNGHENAIMGKGKHNIHIPKAIVDRKTYQITVETSELNNITFSEWERVLL